MLNGQRGKLKLIWSIAQLPLPLFRLLLRRHCEITVSRIYELSKQDSCSWLVSDFKVTLATDWLWCCGYFFGMRVAGKVVVRIVQDIGGVPTGIGRVGIGVC